MLEGRDGVCCQLFSPLEDARKTYSATKEVGTHQVPSHCIVKLLKCGFKGFSKLDVEKERARQAAKEAEYAAARQKRLEQLEERADLAWDAAEEVVETRLEQIHRIRRRPWNRVENIVLIPWDDV